MTTLNIQNITHAVIFILRFKSEIDEQTDDFLATDDLRTVQLHNFHNIFRGNNEQTFSRFKAQNYNLENDDLVLKEIQNRHQNKASIRQGHNCTCLTCIGIKTNKVFWEIHIPVSKTLFLKAINFLPGQDPILSTREVYEIIYYLFMILDNTNIISCILLKQLLVDNDLFGNLKILHQENIHNLMSNYQGTLEAKSIEIKNQEHIIHTAFFNIHRIAMEKFVFVYKDEYNNIALTTSQGDNKKKIHFTVDINVEDLWRPFYCLKIDSAFLSQNYSLIYELLYRNSIYKQNVTLDIDFTKFYQLFRFLSEHVQATLRQFEIFETLLPGIFKLVDSFRLRLSEMTCSIDFRFFLDKKISLCFTDILFTSLSYLPQNLWSISIHDSGIAGNLILPASTKALSLKKVSIDKEMKIVVNDGCLKVEVDEAVGNIDIPVAFGIDALSFNKIWKKCHILRNSTGKIVELSIEEAELSRSWDINMGVKKIYLERIRAEGLFLVTINADCENASFKNCKGIYILAENALLSNLSALAFTLDSELYLSGENGQYKLSMINIHLNTVRTLNEKIKALEVKNVHVQDGALLSSHIGCRNVSFKNCRGSFEFFFGTSLRRITLSQPTNYVSLQFNENTGKYKMSLIRVNMYASWMLSEKLEDLHSESITSDNREHFEIKVCCDKVELVKCRGLFKIPGIQNANQGVLQLDVSSNELHLTKLPSRLFLLHMSDIFIHQTIHILLDIRFGKFEGILSNDNQTIKFEARCEILFLINCYVLIDQPETNIYERLILNKMFEIDRILNVQTKEIFMNNCKIIKDVQLSERLCKLHFYNVKVLKKNTVTIPEQCLNIIVKKSSGAFVILGLNEHELRTIIFFEGISNLHFFRYKGSDHYLLKIENCDIDGHICIRKEIIYVILSNITFNSNRPKDKIDERTVLITESLQLLTLKYCPFLYNVTIHGNLIHLHLEGIYLNHDVIIGDSIKKLTLKDITIKRNFFVVLGKGISYLKIKNFYGSLNFNGILNFQLLCFFGNEKVVYERESQTKSVHLKVESLTFASDYRFIEEVKTLFLIRVKTKNNSKILVNRLCEKIVTSFEGEIYFIEEINVEEAVFINLIPLFKTGCWSFAAPYNIEKIKTPSHLKSIRFENIELAITTVTLNESCENVAIIHCIGNFNLLEMQKLSKFTLHPGGFKRTYLTFPDLSDIEELDLAFDFVLDFFEYLLCNCFNIKTLTLRSLTFTPYDSNWWGFLTSDAKQPLSFFENFLLAELKRHLKENFPSEESTSNLWILLNKVMNLLITPIFNTRSQFKLEALKIIGFYLSDKNLEKLSNFSIIKKLSVDYNFVSIGLFEHLPPNLETLEILSSDIFKPDNKNSMKNVGNAKAIKNMKGPRILIIEGSFFETSDNFSNLPQNLHSLKISYHDLTSIVYEPSIEKIRLRELVVFFKPSKNRGNRYGLASIEKKICMQEMLRYLSDFIDFNRLDSLMVEDGYKKIEYDRFEIY